MFSSSTLWFNFWHYIFPSPLFLEISSEFCLSEVILLTPDSLSYPGLWYSYTHPHPNAWPSPSMAPSPHTRFSVLPLHDFSFRRLSVLNRANVSELLVPLPKKRPDHHICLLRYLYASQEATVRTRHETMDGSKLGKKYIKAVYCHPTYLTYTQSTSCKMPGWMKHKLESRLEGEIVIISVRQMTTPLWQKA